ncbi:rhodanese-like domain-containing protein [Flagellimonas meishanensis]|uniref:rhodanese-like domain-containing protein n=1 Tax=Flagellimonas meishanensis TaxID=2873264 RepID=UPI001CA668E2|nr:rhodanese-like domain-containing protein [[Muricauda] meishanensis]
MALLDFLFRKSTDSESIKILDPETYKKAIAKPKVQLVDVRTAREFNAGHIKGAQNMDFFQRSTFEAGFSKMDKSQPVYLYCQSGNRSQKAAKRLLRMGFTEVLDLKGGYKAWK